MTTETKENETMTRDNEQLAAGEVKLTVTKECRTDLVGDVINLRGVKHIAVREICCDRVEDGLSFGHPVDDGYCYTLACRKLTRDELDARNLKLRIAKLEKKLQVYLADPDDFRNMEEHDRRLAEIREELETLRAKVRA